MHRTVGIRVVVFNIDQHKLGILRFVTPAPRFCKPEGTYGRNRPFPRLSCESDGGMVAD